MPQRRAHRRSGVSVRVDGNRVRVSAELVDASSQQTLWSDHYDRDLAGILSVQSEIAQEIARALQASPSPAEQLQIDERPTDSLEAYTLFLRSLQAPNSDRALNTAAIEGLRHALALDPRWRRRISFTWCGRSCTRERTPKVGCCWARPSARVHSTRASWTFEVCSQQPNRRQVHACICAACGHVAAGSRTRPGARGAPCVPEQDVEVAVNEAGVPNIHELESRCAEDRAHQSAASGR